jgi:hypothetical protein
MSKGKTFLTIRLNPQLRVTYFVAVGTSSGSPRFKDGSSLVHPRITGSIQGLPRIASGSRWGAEGEHQRIICLRKTVKNPPNHGIGEPCDVDGRHLFMHVDVRQDERSNAEERTIVGLHGPRRGLSEPYAVPGDPYSGSLVSEVIRYER